IKQVSTPKPPEVFLKEIGLSADRSNISGYSKGGNVERLILYADILQRVKGLEQSSLKTVEKVLIGSQEFLSFEVS
ncbi:MAG: hypothetical protein WC838_01130, partial [Candidatus Margulisiibacteriota bacterium]